ncbi:aquaporin AQPcic-like [Euwallacea fornicatus]|uniref:aquaporin AQPcic-like n=1 Tax=Euwallacea fornicatus TaxID=995702 RepID=UPI00338EF5D9
MDKIIKIRDGTSPLERTILCAGEVVATAILMFVGCMGGVTGLSGEVTSAGQSGLVFGFAVLIAITAFGHISQAHINPAVTVGAVVLGNFPLINLPIYFMGQMVGAVTGFALLMLVTPLEYVGNHVNSINGTLQKKAGVCSPTMHPDITLVQAFIVEFLSTLILLLVCAAVWDHRNSDKVDSAPVKFAFTVAALSIAVGSYTGCHMNPARSFAPALLNGDWEYHWLYWAAPILGSIAGASMYRFIFSKK